MSPIKTQSLLMSSANNGRATLLRSALALGANPRHLNHSQHTALRHAVVGGHAECIRLLAPLTDLDGGHYLTWAARALKSTSLLALAPFYALGPGDSRAPALIKATFERDARPYVHDDERHDAEQMRFLLHVAEICHAPAVGLRSLDLLRGALNHLVTQRFHQPRLLAALSARVLLLDEVAALGETSLAGADGLSALRRRL